MALMSWTSVVAQDDVAIKTNLLSDAFSNITLGAEVGLAPRWTLELGGSFNVWSYSHGRQWKHWAVTPEARYWLCERFSGHFFGIQANGGQYNVGNIDGGFMWLGTDLRKLKDYRFEGWYIGGAISYGYAWAFARHWNLEGELAIGASYTRYKQYECEGCSRRVRNNRPHTFVGPTELAINLVYIF